MRRATPLAFLSLALAFPAAAHASDRWLWPVRGDVVARFTADDEHPFERGARRGIAIAATPGTVVRSACAGVVAFAGAVGAAGPTVSVRCRSLRATYQGLGRVLVRAGGVVAAGDAIATVGQGDDAALRLGALVEESASGIRRYVDPLTLLADAPTEGVPDVEPAYRAQRQAPPAAVAPVVAPAPAASPAPTAPRQPAPSAIPAPTPAVPLVAWLGLALLALSVPTGTLVRRRRAASRAGSLRRQCPSTSPPRSTT